MPHRSSDPSTFDPAAMTPTSPLAQCQLARAFKRYHHLVAFSQAAITAHPHNIEAWSNFAFGFYALCRYKHAKNATLVALSIPSPTDTKNKLRTLLSCCVLLSRLRNPHNPSPTIILESGWYKARLQHLIDDKQLRPFPTVAEIEERLNPASAGFADCAIVLRRSLDYQSGFKEACTRDGGYRHYPSTLLQGFPIDQTTGGYVFLKDRVSSLRCEFYDDGLAPCRYCLNNDIPVPIFHFPKFDVALPRCVQVVGGPLLAVHVVDGLVPEQVRLRLSEQLGKLGLHRPDSPVPKYHNIIDPNVGAVDGLWVPTEVDVEQLPYNPVLDMLEKAIHLHTSCRTVPHEVLHRIDQLFESPGSSYGRCVMRSDIPDVDPHRYPTLYIAIENVLNTALPLLANLQLPALLLPGPLQVVVKAQRIVVDADDSYVGIWHDDGLREHVVAIVLYYYGVSPSLVGGGMEFASKRRMKLYIGDDGGNHFDKNGVRTAIEEMCRCVFPVSEGTMLVFSNYAAVHRVLPMPAKRENGSREFLAFFIIDQKHSLPLPDSLGPRKERIKRRGPMLREQLKVRGHFGMDDSEVVSTGNGTLSDLAWISSGEVFPVESRLIEFYYDDETEAEAASAIVSRLNMTPPVIGRGSSFLTSLDLPAVQFNPASSWMLHIVKEESGTRVFVNTSKRHYTSVVPENGVRAVEIFEDVDEWLELGLWTDEHNLRERIEGESARDLKGGEEE